MNLVSNIGFGEESTHTNSEINEFANMTIQRLGDLKYAKKIERDLEADNWTFNYHFWGKNQRFPYNLIMFTRRIIKYIYFKLNQFF
tara:strand:+ start:534 stop:791 length:258 start_codon:yes stop_codon:yes gene_type:complete